jgi:hypothetical protein
MEQWSGSGFLSPEDQKFKKNYSWQKFFRSKIAIYLSLGYRRKPSALKREQPAFQNMKFKNLFLFLWVIFALLGPDLDP